MGRSPVTFGHPSIEVGAYLRELCADSASLSGPGDGLTVTCTASEGLLPATTAFRLGLIAEELITSALDHAFPGRRGGRVVVTFAVEHATWRLMVEDSGVDLRAATGGRRGGLRLVRELAGELGGRLVISGLVGGTRCIVLAPPCDKPCSTLREGNVSRYLELTRPLGSIPPSGDEAEAVARYGAAVCRRLAASIALGWLSVEEALDATPPDQARWRTDRPREPQGSGPA